MRKVPWSWVNVSSYDFPTTAQRLNYSRVPVEMTRHEDLGA